MGVFHSPHGSVVAKTQTVTEKLFEGLSGRENAVVLVDGPTGRQVTGADLMTQIRRLAGGLVAQGRGKGHVVAIMAPNIPEYAAVFHGVLYAGGTISPMNPTYTAAEVRHQIKDSGAGTLITVPAFAEVARAAIDGTEVKTVHVIGEAGDGTAAWTELMGDALSAQIPVDLEDHIAVLPYSSGTTGLPKGVMLTHRNVVYNLTQIEKVIHVRPDEMTTAFLPFFHIYGMNVVMNNFLTHGGGLVTMPRFDLESFLRLAQDHKVRQVFLAPPVAVMLAKEPMVDGFNLEHLEYLVSGAAPLSAEVAEEVGRRLGCVAVQAYGMTESSPLTHITPQDAPRDGSIGFTLPGAECRIVDPVTGEDCGVDEEGELWIKSPQVMKGYLNNPEATANTITEDGWLKTGDVACFDADGYCYIRDRIKELIKVSGFAVAPAEIEAALLLHPAIADAAAIGVADERTGETPMGFVVRTSPDAVDEAGVLAFLETCLTKYKRPTKIVFVDKIPKSASGKILRRQLRDQVAG